MYVFTGKVSVSFMFSISVPPTPTPRMPISIRVNYTDKLLARFFVSFSISFLNNKTPEMYFSFYWGWREEF